MSIYMIIAMWAFVGCSSRLIMNNSLGKPKTRMQFIGDMFMSAIFAFVPLILLIIYSACMLMMKTGIAEWLNEDIRSDA